MTTFGDRIREMGKRIGKEEQQIAKELDLTKAQLSHYINGRRKVPSELLQLIVDKYKINPLFLFKEDAPLYSVEIVSSNDYPYLPTTISAGLPINVDGITSSDKITLPDSAMGKWAGKKDIFISKISGDSMNLVMPDQSLIAIKPTPIELLRNGDIVVFSENHNYSVKYYYKQSDKIIFKPSSDNDVHHEQHYPLDANIVIHGKVVLYIVEMD